MPPTATCTPQCAFCLHPALRFTAEAELGKTYDSRTEALTRTRSKTQLLSVIDRLLSDEARCRAYSTALDEALGRGAQSVLVLGMGSLLPAIQVFAADSPR